MSAEDKPQTETIATLRIDLIDSDPPIWREIEVPVAMTLKQLHGIIQAAMDWEDAHLWEFHSRSRAHRQQPRRQADPSGLAPATHHTARLHL